MSALDPPHIEDGMPHSRLRLLEAFVAAWDLDNADSVDATRRAVRKLRQSIGPVDGGAINAAKLIIEGFVKRNSE